MVKTSEMFGLATWMFLLVWIWRHSFPRTERRSAGPCRCILTNLFNSSVSAECMLVFAITVTLFVEPQRPSRSLLPPEILIKNDFNLCKSRKWFHRKRTGNPNGSLRTSQSVSRSLMEVILVLNIWSVWGKGHPTLAIWKVEFSTFCRQVEFSDGYERHKAWNLI